MILAYHDEDGIHYIESKIVNALTTYSRNTFSMKAFFRLIADLAWSLVWLFVLLIIGFFILSWLSNNMGGNFVGSGASWVEQHAQPGY